MIDPTDRSGQFQDRGDQYRGIIFVGNDQQKEGAETSKRNLIKTKKYSQTIVTEIKAAGIFWQGENYHQQFYKKQPQRYKKIKHSRQQFMFHQY